MERLTTKIVIKTLPIIEFILEDIVLTFPHHLIIKMTRVKGKYISVKSRHRLIRIKFKEWNPTCPNTKSVNRDTNCIYSTIRKM